MFAAWANVFLSSDVVEELDNSAAGRKSDGVSFLGDCVHIVGQPDPIAEPGIDTGASAIDDPSDAPPSDTGPADDTGTAIPGEPSAPECAAPGLRLVSGSHRPRSIPWGRRPHRLCWAPAGGGWPCWMSTTMAGPIWCRPARGPRPMSW